MRQFWREIKGKQVCNVIVREYSSIGILITLEGDEFWQRLK